MKIFCGGGERTYEQLQTDESIMKKMFNETKQSKEKKFCLFHRAKKILQRNTDNTITNVKFDEVCFKNCNHDYFSPRFNLMKSTKFTFVFRLHCNYVCRRYRIGRLWCMKIEKNKGGMSTGNRWNVTCGIKKV